MLMNTYIFDVDSKDRNTNLWPNSNNYSISLSRSVYNVDRIRLMAANIDLHHSVVTDNSTFTVQIGSASPTIYTLPSGNYSLAGLAKAFDDILSGSPNSIQVTYSEPTTIIFTAPAATYRITPTGGNLLTVLGLTDDYFEFTGTDPFYLSTVVQSPKSIIFRFFRDDTDLMAQPIYTFDGFAYSARMTTVNSIKYTHSDDPIEIFFNKGSIPYMSNFKVEIYNGDTLETYSFGNRNHFLKFEITCSLDKNVTMNEEKIVPFFKELPEPIDYNIRFTNMNFIKIVIGTMLIIGLLIILQQSKRRPQAFVDPS